MAGRCRLTLCGLPLTGWCCSKQRHRTDTRWPPSWWCYAVAHAGLGLPSVVPHSVYAETYPSFVANDKAQLLGEFSGSTTGVFIHSTLAWVVWRPFVNRRSSLGDSSTSPLCDPRSLSLCGRYNTWKQRCFPLSLSRKLMTLVVGASIFKNKLFMYLLVIISKI